MEIELLPTADWRVLTRSVAIPHSAFYTLHLDRGCSSVGRAVALQAIGQEFESPQLHQPSLAAKRRARAADPRPAFQAKAGWSTSRAAARQAITWLDGFTAPKLLAKAGV